VRSSISNDKCVFGRTVSQGRPGARARLTPPERHELRLEKVEPGARKGTRNQGA